MLRSQKVADRFYLSPKWKDTRQKVLRRDGYICQECGCKALGKRFGRPTPEVDHILPRKEYPKLAYDMSNLRTLCKPCHSRRTIMDTKGITRPLIGPDGYPVGE